MGGFHEFLKTIHRWLNEETHHELIFINCNIQFIPLGSYQQASFSESVKEWHNALILEAFKEGARQFFLTRNAQQYLFFIPAEAAVLSPQYGST